MPVTMTNLAKRCGVSVALVSRLMNGDQTLRVSEKRRQQILDMADELGGIRAHRAGRALATGKAFHVVVPINRIFSPGYVQSHLTGCAFMQSFDEHMRAAQFRVGLAMFDADAALPAFEDWVGAPDYCDGLLLLSRVADAAVAGLLKRRKYPHVTVDPAGERLGLAMVRDDVVDGLCQALSHLTDLGHRRIGFCGPKSGHFEFFLAAMALLGLPVAEQQNCLAEDPLPSQAPPALRDLTHRELRGWLRRPLPATAMICGNDFCLQGALDALQDRGLSVGRDLSLVGYDNIEERHQPTVADPVMTTLEFSNELLGKRCAELLLRQIRGDAGAIASELLPVRLIVRSTTGPCTAG